LYTHYLGSNPANAITFAGVLLLIASIATVFIRTSKSKADDRDIAPAMGH